MCCIEGCLVRPGSRDRVAQGEPAAPAAREGLLVCMLDLDALGAGLAHINDDGRLQVCLACKAVNALRPVGKFMTTYSHFAAETSTGS